MTTFIDPYEQDIISRDMPPSASLVFTLFIGSCLGGLYIYDMYKKQKEYENKLNDLESRFLEVAAIQEEHSETLRENDQRIREKKDYDESEEIEDNKYQCWQGHHEERNLDMESAFQVSIRLWKEGFNSHKQNQEWLNKEDTQTQSVCNYYLGNRNPEFNWECVQKDSFGGETFFTADVSELFVDGWDNTVRLRITITCNDTENLVQFIEEESYHGDKTVNTVLKKCIQEDSIQWSRILIDSQN
jgi:hypothetical protein